MNNLQNFYNNNLRSNLLLKTNEKNSMNLPKINKIVLNIGTSSINKNKNKLLESMLALELITGQKAELIKAKKSIATFNLRKNTYMGCKVTLRNKNAYSFIEKLNKIIFPRIQEFKGLSKNSFNKENSYSFSIKNLIVFPEIEYQHELFNQIIGVDISIHMSSNNRDKNLLLLSGLQIPFI